MRLVKLEELGHAVVDGGEPASRREPGLRHHDAVVERPHPAALDGDHAIARLGHARVDAEHDHAAQSSRGSGRRSNGCSGENTPR